MEHVPARYAKLSGKDDGINSYFFFSPVFLFFFLSKVKVDTENFFRI